MVINDTYVLNITFYDIFFVHLVILNTFEIYIGFFRWISKIRFWKKKILEKNKLKKIKIVKILDKKSNSFIILLLNNSNRSKNEKEFFKLYLKLKRNINIK